MKTNMLNQGFGEVFVGCAATLVVFAVKLCWTWPVFVARHGGRLLCGESPLSQRPSLELLTLLWRTPEHVCPRVRVDKGLW